ncbi:MAG: molybdopterin-synthase adenylyltransferase MoeB [Gammaproteobacteria bacterium]|nr:molybdopterin-synthase adenylyltransferase MoeB [Gammaproteobacteria bacterium]MBU1653275.1 molybdopterin-synthase adenylyltransferase MoeB [Gammaproteobacteria bacterium]MBU1961501.1 molybdopterin-synthase adenylyltransferase MoeB [Gammaproteobacteria bacterium]
MDDPQLLRYGRQILLPEIGIEGQERLLDSRVLIIGMGGLGSPVAIYLAAAGVGRLSLVDHDRVELSNLQRQIAHSAEDIGVAKVESARAAIHRINPECQTRLFQEKADPALLDRLLPGLDLVVDACDNFATRFAINQACVRHGVPLVSGAAVRWEGQITVFSGKAGEGCYRCLYPEDGEDENTCSTTGVASPLVGIIGSLQAMEAIKVLTGAGEPLFSRLLAYDGLAATWRTLRLRSDPQCPVCGAVSP